MKTTTGTIKQPFSIEINLENIIKEITKNVMKGLEESIYQQTDSYTIDDPEECDENTILITGSYETRYQSKYYPATLCEPSEYDVTVDLECLEKEHILEEINKNIPKELQNLLQMSITEDNELATMSEYEPDWDSMPGGHDYY